MNKLVVTIKSREGVKYQGEAEAVTARNEVGEFDILPEHSQFVTPIMGVVIIHVGMGKTERFEFAKGILHVKDDRVEIFGK